MPTHSETVTRATDLLRAAGMKVMSLPTVRIDRDEYESTISGMSRRNERRDGDVVIITGQHEDFGRVTLRREDGVFTIEAEDVSMVRKRGEPMVADQD